MFNVTYLGRNENIYKENRKIFYIGFQGKLLNW